MGGIYQSINSCDMGTLWMKLILILVGFITILSGCAAKKPVQIAVKEEIDRSSRNYQAGLLEGIIFCANQNEGLRPKK